MNNRSSQHEDEHPIVIQFGAMGDLVMLTAVCEAIATRWDSKVSVVTSGAWAPYIFAHQPWLQTLRILPGTKGRIWWLSPSKREIVRWLKGQTGSPIYLFEQRKKFHDVMRAANISEGRFFDFSQYDRRQGEHQIDHFLRMVVDNASADLNQTVQLQAPHPKLHVLADELKITSQWLEAKQVGSPFILIQPGNKKTMRRGSLKRASNLPKYWPESSWSDLIAKIRQSNPDASVILCGVQQERELNDHILARLDHDPMVINLAGELPLDRLFPLMKLAHSMVSVDTGPAHAAAALACPLTVLYGGTDPRHYHPRGIGKVCMVTPQSVSLDIQQLKWAPSDQLVDVTPEAAYEGWKAVTQ